MGADRIVLPDSPGFAEALVLGSQRDPKGYQHFPQIYRTEEELTRIVRESTGGLGFDYEFPPKTLKPTIVGFANLSGCGSLPISESLVREAVERAERGQYRLIGHASISTERPITEKLLGRPTPLRLWGDSMVRHYLCNADLCSAPAKTEDESDPGSLGFMNLWTMASLIVDHPNHKDCRGRVCSGPCPTHDVFGYCGVDAYDSVAADHLLKEQMARYRIPEQLYEETLELSELCHEMQVRGIKINREYVREFEARSEEKKLDLFPYEERFKTGKKGQTLTTKERIFKYFNPKSHQQIEQWAESVGVKLKKTGKKEIKAALLKKARDYNISLLDDEGKFSLDVLADYDPAEIPDLDILARLYEFKDAGKGIGAWFSDEYLDKDDRVHPRFNNTGTSTSRLASSGPNFQNIPVRGFGELVRAALVPDDGMEFLKADACIDPDSKVLTTELKWVRADELKEGQELIGFPEEVGSGVGRNHAFIPTILEKKRRIRRAKYKIKTSRGDTVVAADHPLVVRRKRAVGGGAVRMWILAKDLRPGDQLSFTSEPWIEERSWDAGWIAGFFDGDGWCSTHIGFGQKKGNGIAKRVLGLAKQRGFVFSKPSEAIGTVWKEDGSCYVPEIPVEKYNLTSTWESMRFLGTFRPTRLLEKSRKLWEGRRTWGKNTRSATVIEIEYLGVGVVIALQTSTKTYISDGFLSHNSQLELRACLFLAGLPSPDGDAFQWLVEQSPGEWGKAAENYRGTPRDITKSVSHAADYLEGFDILTGADLMKERVRKEIENGSLRVYSRKYMPHLKRDWEYGGGIVAFTGANLAERLFGNRSHVNRAKALAIQEDIYFKRFPELRTWQQETLAQIESRGYVTLLTGHRLMLYGSPKENAKTGVACLGQGNSAEYIKGSMLTFWRQGAVPSLQVHDELDFQIPIGMSDEKAREFIDPMQQENWRIPGFKAPIKAFRGGVWLEKQMRRII